jgi:hypothetical protein
VSCLTSLRWGQVMNQEQDACRYVACPGAQPVGTESLPGDIIAPLSDLYPRRLWGKPEEVNVGSHVGSDALNLRKSGPELRVHGFWNPWHMIPWHFLQQLFSTVKKLEIQERHIPPPQGTAFFVFWGFGLDSRTDFTQEHHDLSFTLIDWCVAGFASQA